jgi:hypothetical protein
MGTGGSSYTPSGNLTGYACWTANSYTITVDSNGGSAVANQNYIVSTSAQTKTFAAPTYNTTYTVSFDTQGGSTAPGNQTSTKPFSSWSITTNTAPVSNFSPTTTLNIPANGYGNMNIQAQW